MLNIKKLLPRIALFILPFAILLAPPTCILNHSGELALVAQARQAQIKNATLIGRAYSNTDAALKSHVLESTPINTLVMGSSRATQIRSQSFAKPGFYNASRATPSIADMVDLLKRIPDGYEPEWLILVLDQYFFHPQWKNQIEIVNFEAMNHWTDKLEVILSQWTNVYTDYWNDKISLKKLNTNSNTGLTARLQEAGFRLDGSYQYALMNTEPEHRPTLTNRIHGAMKEIEHEGYYFKPSKEISLHALKDLEELLSEANRRHIRVIGILPPYEEQVLTAMRSKQNGEAYAYYDKIQPEAGRIFKHYNYELYDFTSITHIADAAEFIDGFHASEKAYARILIHIAQQNQDFAKTLNINNTKEAIQSSQDPLTITP